MPSKKRFTEHQKTLDERRATVNTLIQNADSHEDLKEVMKQNSKFLDSKYTTVTKYAPIVPEEASGKTTAPTPTKAPSRKSDTDSSFASVFESKDDVKGKGNPAAKPKGRTSSAKSRDSLKKERAQEAPSFFNRVSSFFSSNPPSSTTTAEPSTQSSTLTVPGSVTKAGSADSSASPKPSSKRKSIMKSAPGRLSAVFHEDETKVVKTKHSTTSVQSESGFQHPVEALFSLENASVIFLQRLLDYEEIQAAGVRFHKDNIDLAYQILNVQGTLLFLMEQHHIKCTAFIVYTKRSFENILYDVNGAVVLKFLGPSVIMSRMISRMMITDDEDRILGYVKEFGKKVNYSVYNAKGERLFLVVSNVYIPSASSIFSILYRGQKIGVIKFGWKHVYHDLPYIDYETTGVEFPAEMDEREKALLIGCMMLIVKG
ncbi:unnamed protein product [Orchesella dallaii]|uniref:Phospholipid scramblase n=1 Tax=Orchesella dallaii TaxID=48710 RepID=A0ABP1Q7I3_9HEXA